MPTMRPTGNSVGVEFFRLHRVRLALEARVDLAFFSMSGSSYHYAPYTGSPGTGYGSSTTSPDTQWSMPISVGLSFAF